MRSFLVLLLFDCREIVFRISLLVVVGLYCLVGVFLCGVFCVRFVFGG